MNPSIIIVLVHQISAAGAFFLGLASGSTMSQPSQAEGSEGRIYKPQEKDSQLLKLKEDVYNVNPDQLTLALAIGGYQFRRKP